jgi:hypothetical protein
MWHAERSVAEWQMSGGSSAELHCLKGNRRLSSLGGPEKSPFVPSRVAKQRVSRGERLPLRAPPRYAPSGLLGANGCGKASVAGVGWAKAVPTVVLFFR